MDTILPLIMDCHTLEEIQGQLGIVWLASNCVVEVSLHFQLELNTLRGV